MARKHRRFEVVQKALEILFPSETDAVSPVQVSVLRFSDFADIHFAPRFGSELSVERIGFPVFP